MDFFPILNWMCSREVSSCLLFRACGCLKDRFTERKKHWGSSTAASFTHWGHFKCISNPGSVLVGWSMVLGCFDCCQNDMVGQQRPQGSAGAVQTAARLALGQGRREGMEDDLVLLTSVRCFVWEELIELGWLLKGEDPHSVQSDPL